MRRETFFKGAAVLTLAGFAIRVLGALYRIPLSRILGAHGLGIYGVPSQFYAMTFILATAGIPTAIAKLVSERLAQGDRAGAMRVFIISRRLLLFAGLAGAVLLAAGAKWLIKLGIVQVPESYPGLLAIAPVLALSPLAAAYRGLFAGYQYMTPVAVSQFGDQLFNVLGTLGFAYLLLPWGLPWAAAGGNFGSFPGALAGVLVLSLAYASLQKREGFVAADQAAAASAEKAAAIAGRLAAIGVPISLASISLAIVGLLDNNIIIGGMVARGVTRAAATAGYGLMSQVAMPFVNAATSIAVAVSANLVPAVSRACSMEQKPQASRLIANGLRFTLLFGAPVGLMLFTWSSRITGMLFGLPAGGAALRAVCPAILCWSTYLIVAASLQGMGSPNLPLAALLLGLAVKVGLGMHFIAMGWGVAGVGYATSIGYAVAAAGALVELILLRGVPVKPWLPVAGTILGLVPMAIGMKCGALLAGYMGAAGMGGMLIAALLGLAFYLPCLFFFRSIKRDEIARLWQAGRRRLGRRGKSAGDKGGSSA